MKIFHLIPSWAAGGAEIFVLHLARALNELGHPTTVVAWSSAGPLRHTDPFEGTNAKDLHARGRFDVRDAGRLRRLILDSQVEVVHAHLFPLNWWLGVLPLHEGVVRIYSEHSIANRRRSLRFLRPVERFVYRRMDAVVSVSKPVEESLLQWLPELRQSCCIPNGLPPLAEASSATAGSDTATNRLLFVGRLVRAKGVDVLLSACAQLSQRKIPFSLDVVGDGPERPALEALRDSLNLRTQVQFRGFTSDPTMFFLKRPIVTQPSRWEGLPLVTLEAMRASCPLIATRVGGIPGVVQHEVSGLIVPPDDANKLAAAIATVLENPKLASSLASKGLETFERHHTISLSAMRHAELYARCLSENSRAAA